MPTKKQMNFMWESDFKFGHPNDRGSEHNAIGERTLPAQRPASFSKPRRGKLMGHYVWDKETDSLKLIINPKL
jgi:hypothetical protein